MPLHRIFLVVCILLAAGLAAAQDVTDLGVIPTEKPKNKSQPTPQKTQSNPGKLRVPSAQPSDKILTGEQIFERSVPSLLFIESTFVDGTKGFGSGFIIDDSGCFFTNAHVVENAVSVTATLSDNRTLNITQLLAYDSDLDLAFLQLPAGKYPAIPMVSEKPKVGSTVYAIGNPSGFTNTLSKGLVSGIRPGTAGDFYANKFSGEDASRSSQRSRYLVQHTAAISGGSSGGVLLSESGNVIGINTLHFQKIKDVNFAVPAGDALQIALAAWTPDTPKLTLGKDNLTSEARNQKPKDTFSLSKIDPKAAAALEAAAEDYAIIGVEVCNIQLLERYWNLKAIKNRTKAENEELEYYNENQVPLIVTADGKTTWRDVPRAMAAMNIKSAVGIFHGRNGNDSYITVNDKPYVLRHLTKNLAEDEEFKFFYTPAGETEVVYEGKTYVLPVYEFQPAVTYLNAKQLGALLQADGITSLIHIRLDITPGKTIITGYRDRKGGPKYEFPIYSQGPSTFNRVVTATAIDLQPIK